MNISRVLPVVHKLVVHTCLLDGSQYTHVAGEAKRLKGGGVVLCPAEPHGQRLQQLCNRPGVVPYVPSGGTLVVLSRPFPPINTLLGEKEM